MQYASRREESDFEFKQPLSLGSSSKKISSTPAGSSTSLSRIPVNAPPPINVSPAFGIAGTVGCLISIVTFLSDVAIDGLLAYAMWKRMVSEYNFYRAEEYKLEFIITVSIIVIPLVIANLVSMIWYLRKDEATGMEGIYYRKNKAYKSLCVIFHLVLIGPISRYVDTLLQGRRMQRYFVQLDLGPRGSIQTLTPKGEISAVLQQIMSRDSAMVDLFRSILQDAPQIVYQIFLLYRSSDFYSDMDGFTTTIQVLKILIGIFALSWFLVTYQDEMRRNIPGKKQLTCNAVFASLLWRFCTVSARVAAIGSFASLKVDGEGGLIKVYSDNAPMGLVLSFPSITALILACHWIMMLLWIYSQKSSLCSRDAEQPNPYLEIACDLVMSWVHIFDYVNTKDSPTRRRMVFFYILIFIENSVFIIIWYLQQITKELWLRVLVVFSIEIIFIVGICSAVGYYSFLQPDKSNLRQLNASWKR